VHATRRGCGRESVPTLASLDDVRRFVADHDEPLYVRWSRDVDADIAEQASRDELTGVALPGLSANGLAVEPWWGERDLNTWVARRLYDYRHLREVRGPGTCAWLLTGRECGRGPDNEPLLRDCRVVASIANEATEEATRRIDELGVDWGPLARTGGEDAQRSADSCEQAAAEG